MTGIVSGIPMTTVVMIYGTHVPAGIVNTIVRCTVVSGMTIIMCVMNFVLHDTLDKFVLEGDLIDFVTTNIPKIII